MPTDFPCAASSIYGRFLRKTLLSDALKQLSDPEWPGSGPRSARRTDSAIRWRRTATVCRQLFIPGCPEAVPKRLFEPINPAIAAYRARGLPQQHDGSLGRRRHERRVLGLLLASCRQCSCELRLLHCRHRELFRQSETCERVRRALRPASVRAAFYRGAGPIPRRRKRPARIRSGRGQGFGQCDRRFSNPLAASLPPVFHPSLPGAPRRPAGAFNPAIAVQWLRATATVSRES